MELGFSSFMHKVRTGAAAAGLGAATMLGGAGCTNNSAPIDKFTPTIEKYAKMGDREGIIADSVVIDYADQFVNRNIAKVRDTNAKLDADLKVFEDSIKSLKLPVEEAEGIITRKELSVLLDQMTNTVKANLNEGIKFTKKDIATVDSIIKSIIENDPAIARREASRLVNTLGRLKH